MDKNSFNTNIEKMIDLFAYPFYLVHPDKRVRCTCVNATTKDPEASCPVCLGTGHRIYIRKIEGVYQDSAVSDTMISKGASNMILGRNYFVKAKYPIEQDDIIVDDNEPFFVFVSKDQKSFQNKTVFTKNTTYAKKFNSSVFIANFKKIIGG
jgi:hypothetical protein